MTILELCALSFLVGMGAGAALVGIYADRLFGRMQKRVAAELSMFDLYRTHD